MQKPNFYDPKKVGTIYIPRYKDIEDEVDAILANKKIPASAGDKKKVALMIIDMQIDFCHEKVGTLYVPGAEQDIERLIDFILENLEKLTTIFASLDSHLVYQIFFKTWWQKKGVRPDFFDMIPKKDIEDGIFQALVDPVGSIDYVSKLESDAKKTLMLWTYHTMLGTIGQSLDPALYEILFFHSIARKSQLNFLQKGQIPQTEMYGILSPEVKIPSHKQGGFNTDFLNILMKNDMVIVAGEAKSHCVLESLRQIYDFFITADPDVLKKIWILKDCMSSVKHPVVDFEAIAEAEFAKFKKAGINIVDSIDLKL